jgi:serine/threonine protein phosphatase 1
MAVRPIRQGLAKCRGWEHFSRPDDGGMLSDYHKGPCESERASAKSPLSKGTERAKPMISRKLFFRDSAPTGPKKHRAYVIGDVHGCLEQLELLLSGIEGEVGHQAPSKVSIIFLGDVVDRGPASAAVVERLRTLSIPRTTVHFVMGNHEEVMLRVMDGDTDLLRSWLKFGGVETLRSYGVDPKGLKRLSGEDLSARLHEAIPIDHRRFLANFADSIAFGDYVLVHAGIRPGIELSEQSQSDLRWIRDPFLEDTTDRGFIVVHGHTITNEVEVTPNRIGIDTGAFCTGTLTALAIEGKKRWLIQTSGDEARRVSLG